MFWDEEWNMEMEEMNSLTFMQQASDDFTLMTELQTQDDMNNMMDNGFGF